MHLPIQNDIKELYALSLAIILFLVGNILFFVCNDYLFVKHSTIEIMMSHFYPKYEYWRGIWLPFYVIGVILIYFSIRHEYINL